MNYLKRLVSQFCTSDFDELERLHNEFSQPNSITKNHKLTTKHPHSIQAIIEYCSHLPQDKRGAKVEVHNLGNKKLLLLDLDRTIILFEENKGFFLRPHLRKFLETISKFYVIFIFTAATPRYLEEMLDLISLHNGGTEFISGYLTRENCIKVKSPQKKTAYVKDISVISNVHASQIVIVDDLLVSFCLNPENGILIPAFTGDPTDSKLVILARILLELKDHSDTRRFIRRKSSKNKRNYKNSISTKESESPPKNEPQNKDILAKKPHVK